MRMARQLLLLIFWHQRLDKLSVGLKERRDFKFWSRKLTNWAYLKKTIGGIWI